MDKVLKILIVDDEPLIRRAFLLAGTRCGHKVKAVSDGQGAKDIWLSFDPDLVFLDVLLPDMSGFQVLKTLPKKMKAKCIIISAHDDFQEERENGIHLFVKKPFDDIFEVIKKGEALIFSESILSTGLKKSGRIEAVF